MDSISEKITIRPCFSKAVPAIKKKIVSFKEGKELLSDNCIHVYQKCGKQLQWDGGQWIRFFTFLG